MYITYKKLPQHKQLSFDDLFDNYASLVQTTFESSKFFETFTYYKPLTTTRTHTYRKKYKIADMEAALRRNHQELIPYMHEDMSPFYETFFIPKSSGSMRQIDAPIPEFKEALRRLTYTLERILHCLPHNSAYAYVAGRSTKEALQKHTANESRWYLKVDLKNFFPNCAPDFIYNQLMKLFPFCLFTSSAKIVLEQLIKVCCLNGGLPQGTPTSPILTNLLMLPFDVDIENNIKNYNKNWYVYTRYADDLIISSRYKFDYTKIVTYLDGLLAESPFRINPEKTRFGSNAGRNWNLGLMLNANQDITIGWRKRERFKAMTHQFLSDFSWTRDEVEHYLGLVAYYKKIQPEMVTDLIRKHEVKLNKNFKQHAKQYLA